jgi:Methyltransferase domain/Glycosyl transferase family 2
MNFDFIKSMDGWTSPEKAQAIYDLTLKAKPKVAVEIGVFGGRGTIAIALALKQLGVGKVIGIDPWSAPESAKSQVTPTDEEWWGKVDHEKIYKNFLWWLKKQDVEKFVEVRRESSKTASAPQEIGLLIVDGNHNEEALLDAKKFAPNVPLGGYVLLDDLDWAGGFVRQAEEYIKSIGFSFIKLFDSQTGLYQRVEIVDPTKKVEVLGEERKIIEENPKLTIAYITGRKEPKFEWFFDSLANQLSQQDKPKIIIVDFLAEQRNKSAYETHGLDITWVEPKPTIWQGKHKITKDDWWAMSNARNTAFCLCQTEWIAFLDDRCVLMPGWLEAVKSAMDGNYAVCGSYQKRSHMEVEHGFIKGYQKLLGTDSRMEKAPQGMKNCPGSWMFGCTFALPLEWALAVNGFEEGCDGLSMEDVIFGLMLKNNGFRIDYSPQMRMIEDRTEGEISSGHGVDGVLKRSDKGVSPKDKSHAALERFGKRKITEFTPNLKEIGEAGLKCGSFPEPKYNASDFNWKDWYDGQPISEM